VFSRNDRQADSERFYNSILDFLEDEDEEKEVIELLGWWNRYFPSPNDGRTVLTFLVFFSQVFPAQYQCGARSLPDSSALAKLKQQRHRKRQALGNSNVQNQPQPQPRQQPSQ
jgi:hypothetical protein